MKQQHLTQRKRNNQTKANRPWGRKTSRQKPLCAHNQEENGTQTQDAHELATKARKAEWKSNQAKSSEGEKHKHSNKQRIREIRADAEEWEWWQLIDSVSNVNQEQ